MIPIGILAGLIAMFIWGILDYFHSVLSRELGTLGNTFTSAFFGLPVSIVLAIILRKYLIYDAYAYILMIIGGILMMIAVIHFFESLRVGTVSVVLPITTSFSIITVFLGIFFLGEYLTLIQGIAVSIIILGIILVSTDINKILHIHKVRGLKPAFITLFTWGIYFFMTKVIANQLELFGTKLEAAMTIFVMTSIINNVFQLLYPMYKKKVPSIIEITKPHIFTYLILVTTFGPIAWFAVNYAITLEQVALVIPIASLSPAVTSVLAIKFHNERLVLNQYLGLLILLIGLFMVGL